MFRFTILDALWLMVVAGMGVGWYMHYQRLTRPPKLYRDEEIETLTHYNSRYAVDTSVDPPRLLVVPAGTSMPLSQVFKTLGIDPNRLTDFRPRQQEVGSGPTRSISLSWQLSPNYYLTCISDDVDAALAFDDPNRKIYVVEIQKRENRQPVPPPLSDTTTPGVEL